MKIKDTKISYISKKILKFSFLFIFLISTYFFIEQFYTNNSNSKKTDLSSLIQKSKSEKKFGEKIQIKILNGCGDKGVADLYKNFLRNKGYDVIDYGNAENFNHINTKLKIHSKNHENFIFEIVEILSIKPDKLEYNYSKNIFYDLTLIIGRDYKNLDSFNEVAMHYEPF